MHIPLRGGTGHANAGSTTLKYERLFLEEARDGIELQAAARPTRWSTTRMEYNKIRPHEGLSCNRLYDVHTGLAD